MEELRGEVTQLLRQIHDGDREASSQLVVLVYDGLRRLGAHYLQGERDGHTLQPTDLVHEAYMRLVDSKQAGFNSREHFFGVAAQAMRHILVDHARARKSDKRGGERKQVELQDALAISAEQPENMIAIDQALTQLAELDPRQARVVELIFFAGLTREETAKVLDIAPETVYRDWNHARAFLHKALGKARTQP